MQTKYPLVKLPAKIDFTLRLISEELKSRKLFEGLGKAGLQDCYFQPHLDTLIMNNLGLNDDNDEIFERYNNIITRRSKKIKPHNNSVMKHALKAYQELMDMNRSERHSSKQDHP